MRVGILHYAGPPGIGGVEQTMYYHARELTRAGHAVRILAGAGQASSPGVEVTVIPEAGSSHPAVLAVKGQLDRGEVSADFLALRDRLVPLLAEALEGLDALIAHNVFTLNKNLALSAALFTVLQKKAPRVLGWHHDLAWEDPRYRQELRAGYPWDLLRRPWDGVRNVTVSAAQRGVLAELYGVPPESIAVVPPGVDAARFLRWTEATTGLVQKLALLEADLLLLLPARLTRRKNVEMALQVLAALRRLSGQDARLVVTGPPGPHNPANAAYLDRLLQLRRELGLAEAAHFLYEQGWTPDDATMADLYLLADAMLFASTQEGFGIPLLEAGLARLPIFCSDIAPFREVGQDQVHRFALDADPATVARDILHVLDADPAARLRRRVLAEYQWEAIVRQKVLPLLEARG